MESNGNPIVYPTEAAPRGDTVFEYPSADGTTVKVPDPYHFLEDPDSEATKAWVAAENKVTNAYLDECDLIPKLKAKLTSYWNYAKIGIPTKRGDHYFFNYNSGLQNQPVRYKINDVDRYLLN